MWSSLFYISDLRFPRFFFYFLSYVDAYSWELLSLLLWLQIQRRFIYPYFLIRIRFNFFYLCFTLLLRCQFLNSSGSFKFWETQWVLCLMNINWVLISFVWIILARLTAKHIVSSLVGELLIMSLFPPFEIEFWCS